MAISNSSGLWIKPIPVKRIENEHGWAELRIKYDSEDDLTSARFDVLVGRKKDGKVKIHVIISLCGRIINFRSRGVTQSFGQKIESKIHGQISDETLV